MSLDAVLRSRRLELRRRVEALPAEVNTWRQAASKPGGLDMNAHFSQLLALGTMINVLTEEQVALADQLDRSTPADFGVDSLRLVQAIVRAQRVWDFFRDKLELRHSPLFQKLLWTADTIAYDCHHPIMTFAVDQQLIAAAEVREPPLTYCTAEFSPATWVRGSRPNDGRAYNLGEAKLPIPVIEFPWDHLQNLWELTALLHEVGHDIEADLRLRAPLQSALSSRLDAEGVPARRKARWLAWQAEIFADLLATRLGGAGFVEGLMHLLILPAAQVLTVDDVDPHPTHYIRILLNAHYACVLLPEEADAIRHVDALLETWRHLYGQAPELAEYASDFEAVCDGLMGTALEALRGRTVADLVSFTAADDQNIRRGAAYLQSGTDKPVRIRPRHCVCAARIAASATVAAGPDAAAIAAGLDKINDRLMQLVRENDLPVLRTSGAGAPHKTFIANLTRALSDEFDRPE